MVKTSRNNYSEAEKQRIIERFHESGLSVNQFALNEKISRANIQEWKKIGPKPPKKKTREPQYDSIGDAVCAWLMGERAKGLVVTNQDFREKARELAKLDGIPDTFKVSPGWVAKMKKRNRLTYRKAGHVSRKLAPTEKDLAEQEEFHEELQEKVVLSQTPLRNIINQDQTCMRMVSPYGLTLDKIGTKEVLTVQPGGEKNTFTVSLAIRADGSKLPAVIIFKATNKKTGRLSESIMGKLKIPNNCIVWSSLSGWWKRTLGPRVD
ncbi:hypothetical protein BV898_08144 [Hypsibius exemplaris]|uniref:HTH CENPB-type domain-containing protein n=1 Tax=Hypsibius exemplaris TaxID=2072580 RepID=A0A1W0WR57_HYPEX|nr:hypothetical protein BV898_08144 [Hypsibius exemplaris]